MFSSARKQLAIGVLVFGGFLFAGQAPAEIVTWEFEGEVTDVSDQLGLLGNLVNVGDPIWGQYTFDSTTPDAFPNDPSLGVYSGALFDIHGFFGDLAFTGPYGKVNGIGIENGVPHPSQDGYLLGAGVLVLDRLASFRLEFSGPGFMFLTDELPVMPPRPDVIHGISVAIFSETIDFPISIDGRISRLVPEPTCGLLLAVGVVMLAHRRRKKSYGESPTQNLRIDSWKATGCFILALSWGPSASAQFVDCNENGVNDADELTVCPDIEIVFIIDASQSMTNQRLTHACNTIDASGSTDDILGYLADAGLTVHHEIRSRMTLSDCLRVASMSAIPV